MIGSIIIVLLMMIAVAVIPGMIDSWTRRTLGGCQRAWTSQQKATFKGCRRRRGRGIRMDVLIRFIARCMESRHCEIVVDEIQ